MKIKYSHETLMGRPYDPIKPAGTRPFSAPDTKEKYQKSLETQPADWRYRTQTVEYRYNTQGFRAPELDQIDWKRSIVILGCSQTEGVGLDESETIGAQLEKLTGIPVVNLGTAGVAMHFSYANNLVLRKNYPTPLAVINYWTSCRRMVWYCNQKTVCILPDDWEHFYRKHYLNLYALGLNISDIDHDDNVKAQVLGDSAAVLWESTRYSQATWSKDTSLALGCKLINQIDTARDLQHHGPQTARMAAEYFAEQLNL